MVACAFNAPAAAIKFEPQIERINADQNGTDWAHRWDVLISVNPQTLRLIFTTRKRGERETAKGRTFSPLSLSPFSLFPFPLYPFRDFLSSVATLDKFRITAGNALHGRVSISGAKNSALPCMAAALLTPETVILHNLPYVRDIITPRRLREDVGATVLTPELRTHKITASHVELFEAPYELVRTMRASVLVLGPLLARFGKAKVSLPGGCAIGTRPIDLHLAGFEKFGAEVKLEGGNVVALAPEGGLRGADVEFEKVTVTGTENLMMAAALANGTTTLKNAAREP